MTPPSVHSTTAQRIKTTPSAEGEVEIRTPSDLPLSDRIPSEKTQAVSAFDALAVDYDRTFTHSLIGTRMRQAVWRRIAARFRPGDRILELNCGTGEDALYLGKRGCSVLATDASSAMVAITHAKIAQAGLQEQITVQQIAIEEIAPVGVRPLLDSALLNNECLLLDSAPLNNGRLNNGRSNNGRSNNGRSNNGRSNNGSLLFDGALSNFGGLNCVANLRGVADGVADCLRPGGWALLCIMGPVSLWEWGWYLAQRQPGRAFRRLRRNGVAWRGLTIRYPTIGALRRAFAPRFRCRRVSAIGALLPPPYAEAWAARHPRLLDLLDRWERRWEAIPPLPFLADHYLLELERV